MVRGKCGGVRGEQCLACVLDVVMCVVFVVSSVWCAMGLVVAVKGVVVVMSMSAGVAGGNDYFWLPPLPIYIV